jgi:hypothetical protein
LAWSGRMVVDALAMMALARVKQPSILTLRGAYAAATSTASSAAVATVMLLEVPMAPLWTVGLVVVSVLLGATFLRRDERWAILSIALPWLRASTEAGKP